MSLKPPSLNTAALEVKLLSHLFLRQKGPILAHYLKVQSNKAGKVWQERREVAGPSVSTVRKQRTMNAGAQLVSSLSPSPSSFSSIPPPFYCPMLSISVYLLSISPFPLASINPGLLHVPDFVILDLPGPHSLTSTLLHSSLPHLDVVP